MKIQCIKKRKDFLYLSDKGNTVVTPAFVLKCAIPSRKFHENEKSAPCKGGIRIGYVVRKKIGIAVDRNYVRRRFREMVRELMPVYGVEGYDYVIIARSFSTNRKYEKMKKEFTDALKKLKSEVENAND